VFLSVPRTAPTPKRNPATGSGLFISREDRGRILLHLLCEDNSIRAVTRLTGASKKVGVLEAWESFMFRDPKIVLGLMAFWTFVLIAWALFEGVPAMP
jgi:hypothetical protein